MLPLEQTALLFEVTRIRRALARGALSYEQAVERFVSAIVESRLPFDGARAAVKPVSRRFVADRRLDRRFSKLLATGRTLH